MEDTISEPIFVYFMMAKSGRKTYEFNTPVSYKTKSGNVKAMPLEKKVFKYLVKLLRNANLL